ncbi:MAG: class I tRNA ligase family protein, partial [Planctomycetota bacterium]
PPAPLPQGERGEQQLRAEDRWILSRLNATIQAQTQALEAFELSKATNALYDFFWNEFCAWYIELAKPRMAPGADAADSRAASAVLLHVLDRSLRLLHPFCPFVSEALWTELNKRAKPADRHLGAEYNAASMRQNDEMLAVAAWPKADEKRIDAAVDAQFASLFDAVVAVRAVRQELIDNSPKERKKDVSAALAGKLNVAIRMGSDELAVALKAQSHIIERMANTLLPEIAGANVAAPHPSSATAIKGGTIYVALSADLVDVEKLRLGKEIKNYEQYIPRIEGKLKNDNFVKNAPPEVVEEERARLNEAKEKLVNLVAALGRLVQMGQPVAKTESAAVVHAPVTVAKIEKQPEAKPAKQQESKPNKKRKV